MRSVAGFIDGTEMFPTDEELAAVQAALTKAIEAVNALGPRYRVISSMLILERLPFDSMADCRDQTRRSA